MQLIRALTYTGLLFRHRLAAFFFGPTVETLPRASASEHWRYRRQVEMFACALVAFLVLSDAAVLNSPPAVLIGCLAVLGAVTSWRYWRLSREIREAQAFEDMFYG